MLNTTIIKINRKHLTYVGELNPSQIKPLLTRLIDEHENKFKTKIERVILHGIRYKSKGTQVRIAALMNVENPLKIFEKSEYLHLYTDKINNEIALEGTIDDDVFLLRICVVTTSKNKRLNIKEGTTTERLLQAVSLSVNLRNWNSVITNVVV